MCRSAAEIRQYCVPLSDPFSADGGLKVVRGNLGRAVVKVSSVKSQCRVVEAPAAVFDDQEEVIKAFKAGCAISRRHRGDALPGPSREWHA